MFGKLSVEKFENKKFLKICTSLNTQSYVYKFLKVRNFSINSKSNKIRTSFSISAKSKNQTAQTFFTIVKNYLA